MKPKRVQLRRTKGWKLPENTIRVCRPGPFGNPYRVGAKVEQPGGESYVIHDAQEAVDRYKAHLATCLPEAIKWFVEPLRGKNLACWCPLDQPCHADHLLALAAFWWKDMPAREVTPNDQAQGRPE